MTTNFIAESVKPVSGMAPKSSMSKMSHFQRGVSLIELMVGIAIGLMVIAVAMGALIVSRGVSGSVSDASQLQQQAAYAFRVIGLQLRQAGALRLNMAVNKDESAANMADPVAFESKVAGFDPAVNTISSTNGALTTGYRNYKDNLFSGNSISLMRDCGGASGSLTLISSTFVLVGSDLRCNNQPIVRNVASFQVRYLLQKQPGGNPTLQYVDAAGVNGDWSRVTGVEVCLVLYGDERIDMVAGSAYTDCTGTQVNMTDSALTDARRNHVHKIYRSVYQLRSQGLV